MLRQQDSATRETKNLDGMWAFRIDHDGVGRAEGWPNGRLPQARAMAVPASYNDLLTGAADREFFGDLWYQRRVRVPRGWAGQPYRLYGSSRPRTARRCGSTGARSASHEGGYLPFEADLTDVVDARARRCSSRSASTTRCPSSRSHRASSRTPRRAPSSGIGTTSSTTPACTGPSGWRRPPTRPGRRRHGRHRHRRRRRHRAVRRRRHSGAPARVVVRLLDADGAEVAAADGASGRTGRARRARCGDPGRRTCTTS